jgi:rfaE bifunctional protein nucleotidyltransferase chain/domain
MNKILSLTALSRVCGRLRRNHKKVVFTNGTFDILHRGHVEYLTKARALGDVLIVGLNTDASIRRIKGKGRPVNPQRDRAIVLSALSCVDFVCFFSSNTPYRMIARLHPDILVKGSDWSIRDIVGKDIVEKNGGVVRTIRLTPGRSTSTIISRILRGKHQV